MSVSLYRPSPVRVVFGEGCIAGLAGEAARLGHTASIIICSAGREELGRELAAGFAEDSAIVCAAALAGFPQSAFDAVMRAISEEKADGLIALGGGTAIGLAKAAAAATKLPTIAVPTTYSGSELAPNWYVGKGEKRRQGLEPDALPKIVFYDPRLTMALPAATSAASGMNAMAHAVETLYAPDLDPATEVMAIEAVKLLSSALPRIADDPNDAGARSDALRGAWFAAGFRSRIGLEHVIAQRVGQAFGLEHASTHAVTLPHVAAFNRQAANGALAQVAHALGATDAAAGLHALNRRLSIAEGYKDLGMPQDGIDRATDAAAEAASAITHPRAATRDDVRAIVEAAWAGGAPADG